MCNKFLKLGHIAYKKPSYALRMIMSEIGLHSFSTCIQLIISSFLCTRKDWQCLVRIIKSWITRNRIFLIVFFTNCKFWSYKRFLQKLHRWIWAFCSHIDLCSSSTFATWNEPAIFYNRRAQALFYVLHANLHLFWCSIHVHRCRIRTRYKTNT